MPLPGSIARHKVIQVVALALGIGSWYLVVLPFLFERWSPPCPSMQCPGPAPRPATVLVLGALAPPALAFATTARPRRTLALGLATAILSAVGFLGAQAFEARTCPNIYANGCHGGDAIALLYWVVYLGPALAASLLLGPSRWRSHVALAMAGLVGLGAAAAPTLIGDARFDGDGLFASVALLPFFALPPMIAATIGYAVRSVMAHLDHTRPARDGPARPARPATRRLGR
jgi:hypothetical protein